MKRNDHSDFVELDLHFDFNLRSVDLRFLLVPISINGQKLFMEVPS